jgi:8-oxo-dGTP diphosphatase
MPPDRPKVGVGVFVIKDGKFPMLLRQGSHAAGDWALAGGHLELGETWEDCAARETQEELGIGIKNVRFLSATNDIFAESKHYVLIFMVADWASGKAVNAEPEKASNLKWFTLDTLPSNSMLPIRNLLKQNPDNWPTDTKHAILSPAFTRGDVAQLVRAQDS